MNPGPAEEAGETARGLIEALKTQPVLLALVVFQCVFLIVGYIGLNNARRDNLSLVEKMAAQQNELAKMLYNCIPSDRK